MLTAKARQEKNIKCNITRADIIKGGKNIKAPPQKKTLMYETQALANIILDYMVFQSFSFTVRAKLKKHSSKVRKIRRLAFFFPMSKVF